MKTILRLLSGLLLATLAAPAQDYRLIDLGALIDPHSYALAINQRGQVAGYGRTETGARAFLYSGGVITDLGPLGGTNSYGTSINLFGHVAGFSDMANGPRAFIFRNGAAQRFEPFAGLDHYVFGINDTGWVVGYVSLPAGDQAFVFDGVEATCSEHWEASAVTLTPSTPLGSWSAVLLRPAKRDGTRWPGMGIGFWI